MADYELSKPPQLYWPLNYWPLNYWPGYFSNINFLSENHQVLVPFECRDVIIEDEMRLIHVD